ncbi:MAG: beta-ketoacyl-ACP reductase [Patescibacteria group bacterium]
MSDIKKVALITGSSRGIGKAIAIALAKSGHTVILHASHVSEALETTEHELKTLGAWASTMICNVSDRKDVESACAQILESVGTVDILVNNAGASNDKLFTKMSDQEFDAVIKTNLYGPFYVTHQFLPKMQEHTFGRIINMSSIAVKGAFGKTNYSAAKAGIIGLTKSLALEVGKYSITVNAVCPGYIDTEMSASIPKEYRNQFLTQIALGRIGSPEEVAHVVTFLASEQASYISGAVIDVNGGWL